MLLTLFRVWTTSNLKRGLTKKFCIERKGRKGASCETERDQSGDGRQAREGIGSLHSELALKGAGATRV